MIVDILKERGIKTKPKASDAKMRFDAEFCSINDVVSDVKRAKESITQMIHFKKIFKTSNDPTESDKIYKQCQEENRKTDSNIKSAKTALEADKKTTNGKS